MSEELELQREDHGVKTRMPILIVEDDEARQRWFYDTLEEAAGYDIRIADSGGTALDQFRETQFDLAFFDHDLGSVTAPSYRGLAELNGSRLLGEVLNHPKRYYAPKVVWIHSANPVGAENIRSKCRSAGIPCHVEDYGSFFKNPEAFLKTVAALCQSNLT